MIYKHVFIIYIYTVSWYVPWLEKKSPGYRDELIGESKRMAAVVPPEFRLIGSRKARAIVSPRTTRGLGRRRRHHVGGSQKLFKVFPFIALLSHCASSRDAEKSPRGPSVSRILAFQMAVPAKKYPSVISNHITTTASTTAPTAAASGYFAGILRRRVCKGEAVRCCRSAACLGPRE